MAKNKVLKGFREVPKLYGLPTPYFFGFLGVLLFAVLIISSAGNLITTILVIIAVFAVYFFFIFITKDKVRGQDITIKHINTIDFYDNPC